MTGIFGSEQDAGEQEPEVEEASDPGSRPVPAMAGGRRRAGR